MAEVRGRSSPSTTESMVSGVSSASASVHAPNHRSLGKRSGPIARFIGKTAELDARTDRQAGGRHRAAGRPFGLLPSRTSDGRSVRHGEHAVQHHHRNDRTYEEGARMVHIGRIADI